MKGNHRFSLIGRFGMGKSQSRSSQKDGSSVRAAAVFNRGKGKGTVAETGLKGTALEQAYRELMLENQLLLESNEHLHERISRIEAGLEESPAAKQLIRAQRNALAERSHRLREVQYENINLKREQKKLVKENQKLAASLARRMQDVQPLLNREQLSRRELEEAKAALRKKSDELAKLTHKYYQLEARSKPRRRSGSAVNSRF